MIIEADLLAQLQVTYWKQMAYRLRLSLLQSELQQLARQEQEIALQLQSLLQVTNNRYEVKLGETHTWDPETGQINEVGNDRQ